MHSECLTGDVLGSDRCDCGPQLRESVERVAAAGGLLLYLRQEGRGIGLYAKLDAYALQDDGLDTYDANLALGYGADERDYTVAAQMLLALGVDRVALLTNNPDKVHQLERLGIEVAARCPPACTSPRPTRRTWRPRSADRRTPSSCRRSEPNPSVPPDAYPRVTRWVRFPLQRPSNRSAPGRSLPPEAN